MQTGSKNLMETLSDIYEKEWVGQDMLYVQAQNHEMLWADVAHKLSDQVVIPLNTYQAQFPEMRVSLENPSFRENMKCEYLASAEIKSTRINLIGQFFSRKRLTREDAN